MWRVTPAKVKVVGTKDTCVGNSNLSPQFVFKKCQPSLFNSEFKHPFFSFSLRLIRYLRAPSIVLSVYLRRTWYLLSQVSSSTVRRFFSVHYNISELMLYTNSVHFSLILLKLLYLLFGRHLLILILIINSKCRELPD